MNSGQKTDGNGLGIMVVQMNERKIQGNKKRFDRERRKKKRNGEMLVEHVY